MPESKPQEVVAMSGLLGLKRSVDEKLIGKSKNDSHRARLFLPNLLHERMRSGQKEQ